MERWEHTVHSTPQRNLIQPLYRPLVPSRQPLNMNPIVMLTRFDELQVSLDKLPVFDRSSSSSRISKLSEMKQQAQLAYKMDS